MMDFSKFKKLSIGGVELKQLFIDGIQVWKAGYKNLVPVSTDTDGSIYNGTGYIEGYRLSSSGALKEQVDSVATGFIPARPGDTIRMAGVHWETGAPDGYVYIVYYDKNFNKLATLNRFKNTSPENGVSNVAGDIDRWSSYVLTDSNGVTTFDVVFTTTVDYHYIRISADGKGADMVVTINEPIE